MKRLVAYFSASGVTESAAKKLASAIGVDLFEIKPVQPYSSADLDWTNKNSRSSVEYRDKSIRPEIAEKLGNMADYDVVYIGFPIWWYVAPSIINTFVESYDFAGKTLIPFATSGGSGMGKTVDVLRPLCSEKAVWKSGRVINRMSESELKKWAENAEK